MSEVGHHVTFRRQKTLAIADYYCLAQLNFTSKAVFLENSFMSDFLDEAKLF